ncbi:Phosphoribosyl transferase domain [Yersinia bercovieri]|nr:Phosphoribosyl transferase domain [Yersinia bercovieri]
MGLTLEGNLVTVDHSHHNWLITTPAGNPTVEMCNGLIIYSIFKRRKASGKQQRNRKQRQLGDNCPIIYAIKGKEGLTTDVLSIKKLNLSFKTIVDDIAIKEPLGYQMVISMPSAHNISHIIGKRFAKKFQSIHIKDILRKISIAEAFDLLRRADVSVEDSKSLSFRIKKQQTEVGYQGNFSLKGIPIEFRDVLPPLSIHNRLQLEVDPTRILIVDDLLASGTTLLTAETLIKTLYPYATVHAACLFSSIGR